MLKTRLIACLLWRDGYIVQTINFKATNLIGDAFTAVDFFNTWAIDEIVLLDVSPTDQKRSLYHQTIAEISRRCFVPLTVGGKIKTIEEIRQFLKLGADKITINSQAVERPDFITKSAKVFGSQCIVVSIDTRQINREDRVFIKNGQRPADLKAVNWAKQAESLSAGEIFLTSIDQDGQRQGYDLALISQVSKAVNIPIIASGGVGNWQHLAEGVKAGADAVSAANIFHYTEQSTKKAKNYLKEAGINVREPEFYNILLPRQPKYRVNL